MHFRTRVISLDSRQNQLNQVIFTAEMRCLSHMLRFSSVRIILVWLSFRFCLHWRFSEMERIWTCKSFQISENAKITSFWPAIRQHWLIFPRCFQPDGQTRVRSNSKLPAQTLWSEQTYLRRHSLDPNARTKTEDPRYFGERNHSLSVATVN